MGAKSQEIGVWLHCETDQTHLSQRQLISALAQEGVVTCPRRGGGRDPRFGLAIFEEEHPDLYELLQNSSHGGFERILVVASTTAALNTTLRWKLLQAGASDVFAWEELEHPAAAIAARLHRYAEIDGLLQSRLVQENLVGCSEAWVSVLRQVIEVARFTDSSVLLTGESGTGKELVARLIHSLDTRENKGQLVVLDCSTVVPELSGSEFFGHERGAFTHAIAARDGAFALANEGTLFLDEVGELGLTLQAELLRVVQERTYKRVGSNTWHQVNFRLVCATNRDLLAEEAKGRFRRDLYFRIASWTCSLPPLRERQEDVLPLARHFLKEVFNSGPVPDFDPAVRDYLLTREYPGNVRELRQLTHRIAKRHVGEGPITLGDLPEDERLPACRTMQQDWRNGELQRAVRLALSQGVGLRELTTETAKVAIQIALQDEEGSVRRAALKLRVTDRALQLRRAADQRHGSAARSALPSGRDLTSWALAPKTKGRPSGVPPPPV